MCPVMVIRAETGNIWQPTTSETHSWDFLSSNFAKYLLQLDWTNRNSSDMFSGLIRGAPLPSWRVYSGCRVLQAHTFWPYCQQGLQGHISWENGFVIQWRRGGYSNKEGTNTFLCVTHFQSLSKAYPKTI